jgi:hypothetical protein
MLRVGIAACLLALSGAAYASPIVPVDNDLCEAPQIPKGRSFSDQIEEKLTRLGETVDGHLGRLTLDHIDFRFDGHERTARIRLRGESGRMSLHLDSDILFDNGCARVDARITLAIGARRVHLDLPDFEMVPRSMNDERYVEYKLPLLEGSF